MTEPKEAPKAEPVTGLALLRQPFPEHHISKLPKPTRAQTEAVKADFKKGIRCKLCGGWHHPDVVHLDYVGHAALTDRLLDCDLEWNWEPINSGNDGLPLIDQNGGMWIKLTVCGVTRLGYGHSDGKKGGDAIKEVIGDALRNAAMRFGAALDLWHKGDLHGPPDATEAEAVADPKRDKAKLPPVEYNKPDRPSEENIITAVETLEGSESLDDLKARWAMLGKPLQVERRVFDTKERVKTQLAAANTGGAIDDEIPY